MLRWIRKGLNYEDLVFDKENSMVCKRVVAFNVAIGQISLLQILSCLVIKWAVDVFSGVEILFIIRFKNNSGVGF